MQSFAVTIGVYDYLGSNIETLRGPYSISLMLSPTGEISGTVVGNTSTGVLNLSGLRILSAGTFAIVASSSGITSATSASSYVTNYVYSVSVTTSSSSLTMNFAFQVTITLKGEDNKVFLGTSTIVITEANGITFTGTGTQSTSTGVAIFEIYFATAGQVTLRTTCGSVSANTPLTILQEKLKITSITPTVKHI